MGETRPLIFVINPGSTSTRAALYRGEERIGDRHLPCPQAELAGFKRVVEQVPMRTAQVMGLLAEHAVKPSELDGIAARGGPLRPVPGGVYRVNAALLADARSDDFVEHISKTACLIAADLSAQGGGIPAFIVDPVSTDEYDPISRVSGLKELPRKSLTHALNLKSVARRYARELGRDYAELNLITAQLGGGTSLAVHAGGRMIDSVDANGEGPFSPERAGGLRADDLARMILREKMDFPAVRKLLTRGGGLTSHLGTADAKAVEERAAAGDPDAAFIYEAMAYAISKHICALAAAVSGKVDGILITGGLARSKMLTDAIRTRVSFLGPVRLYPGEFEMEALRDGVRRVLAGEEREKIYPSGDHA
jgi:butyrate kinase